MLDGPVHFSQCYISEQGLSNEIIEETQGKVTWQSRELKENGGRLKREQPFTLFHPECEAVSAPLLTRTWPVNGPVMTRDWPGRLLTLLEPCQKCTPQHWLSKQQRTFLPPKQTRLHKRTNIQLQRFSQECKQTQTCHHPYKENLFYLTPKYNKVHFLKPERITCVCMRTALWLTAVCL